MNGGTLAEALVGSGLDAADASDKRMLFQDALDAFAGFADGPAAHALWVPGRIEVFGKHTDYAGGHSLVGPVPRGFGFVARARNDGVVRLLDARRGETLVTDPSPPEVETYSTGWHRYACAVVRRLSRNFPGGVTGADVVLASDLPSASGMSSSSALIVGLAAVLVRLGRLDERPEWQAEIRAAADAAGYYACVENGLSFGQLAGDAGVGTYGGSEDHIAILCGVPRHLSAWRFVPIQRLEEIPVQADWSFVMASSGVAAKKTGGAREAYNRLSREAAALLDLWNRREAPQRSLYAALASDPAASTRLRAHVRSSGLDDAAAADLERRLTHLENEDARVLEAAAAFRTGDRARLSLLGDASQADAERLLRNQVPETIALARAARELGAFAASSFGAGFGGSVWALVERDAAPDVARRWLDAYRQRFPGRSKATVFTGQPGPPLTWLA